MKHHCMHHIWSTFVHVMEVEYVFHLSANMQSERLHAKFVLLPVISRVLINSNYVKKLKLMEEEEPFSVI